jgi:hypothetical protein
MGGRMKKLTPAMKRERFRTGTMGGKTRAAALTSGSAH